MTTYILKEREVDKYFNYILKDSKSLDEASLKIAILGLKELEVEEAKKLADVGDCLIFKYTDKLVPFQVIDKTVNGDVIDVILQSYYLLEKRAFDQNTNVWRDAEIRKYLNGEFLKKLDPEFVKLLKTEDVHTDDYVTQDKIWLPSHEEIGYTDTSGMFKKNDGSRCYEYYKSSVEDAVA